MLISRKPFEAGTEYFFNIEEHDDNEALVEALDMYDGIYRETVVAVVELDDVEFFDLHFAVLEGPQGPVIGMTAVQPHTPSHMVKATASSIKKASSLTAGQVPVIAKVAEILGMPPETELVKITRLGGLDTDGLVSELISYLLENE